MALDPRSKGYFVSISMVALLKGVGGGGGGGGGVNTRRDIYIRKLKS
jgi:hypothetical protein